MSENQSWFENGNPKMMFVFGFVAGIAVVSLLFSGSILSGNGIKLSANTNTETAVDTNDDDNDNAVVLQPSNKTEIPEVSDSDHVRGDIDAKVVVVEYSDFECPYCGRHHPNMIKLYEEYGDKIAWVYRHFPLSFHAEAMPAAIASECAGEQGKFWEFSDLLFENQDDLGDDLYEATAKELGLDVNDFLSCLDSGKYDDLISEQENEGAAAGVNGTPATFVNGEMISGAVPYATLKAAVETALAE